MTEYERGLRFGLRYGVNACHRNARDKSYSDEHRKGSRECAKQIKALLDEMFPASPAPAGAGGEQRTIRDRMADADEYLAPDHPPERGETEGV